MDIPTSDPNSEDIPMGIPTSATDDDIETEINNDIPTTEHIDVSAKFRF